MGDYDENGIHNPNRRDPCGARHKTGVACVLPVKHAGIHMGYDLTQPDIDVRPRYGPPHPGKPVTWRATA